MAVHADLPPFAKPGQTIDVTVSSIANAKSLRGGTLLITPLKGMDGQVYAIAQGNLAVGGLGMSGQDGSKVTVNVPSVGRIPNGATRGARGADAVRRHRSACVLNLHQPDFTTATHLADSINQLLGAGHRAARWTRPPSASRRPSPPADRISVHLNLENLEVTPGEAPARVIINSRTGTVVINSQVRVSAGRRVPRLAGGEHHRGLRRQPAAALRRAGPDGGDAPESISMSPRATSRMFLFKPGVDLNDIVKAVNEVGAAPGDLVAILEALREAGALRAELLVI